MIRVLTVFAMLFLLAASAFATIHNVQALANSSFSPQYVTIQSGDTVRWTNVGGGFHNAVEVSPTPVFDSGNPSSSNWVYTWPSTTTPADSYRYHCEVHTPGMFGYVIIQGGGGNNDNCDEPTVIEDGDTEYSTLEATLDGTTADLPAECDEGFGIVFGPDIWFSYTASCNGTATFSTCNQADYDSRLACYTMDSEGCPPCPTNNNNFYVCNDDGDGCAGFSSLMAFEVVTGTCYLVRVGGYGDATGSGTLTVTCEAPPAPGIEVTPAALDFDTVEVNQTDTRTFTIHNSGTAALVVSSITPPAGYTTTPAGPPIQPNQNRIVTVTFAPTAAQVYAGDIVINSNAPTSPTTVTVTGEGFIIDDADGIPTIAEEYYVVRNYPNPFNPTATISFAIPRAEHVRLSVFNTLGQEIAVLSNEMLSAGRHNFSFNGADLPSGLYIAQLKLMEQTLTSKLLLLK